MPVGKTGTTSLMACVTYGYQDGSQRPGYNDVASFPVSRALPATGNISVPVRTSLAAITLRSCLPGHFRQYDLVADVQVTWAELQFGNGSLAQSDVLDIPREPYVNLSAYGNSGSYRHTYEFDAQYSAYFALRTGNRSGNRAASLIIHDAVATYSEYIPDVVGGTYTPISSLYTDHDTDPYSPGHIVRMGDGVYRLYGPDFAGLYYISQPNWHPLDNTASYSTDGVVFEEGMVMRITLLDYEIDPASTYDIPYIDFHRAASQFTSPATTLYCHAAAEQYGRVTYFALPSIDLTHIGMRSRGLLWADVKLELYSSYTPVVPPFWTGFVRSMVKSDGVRSFPGPAPGVMYTEHTLIPISTGWGAGYDDTNSGLRYPVVAMGEQRGTIDRLHNSSLSFYGIEGVESIFISIDHGAWIKMVDIYSYGGNTTAFWPGYAGPFEVGKEVNVRIFLSDDPDAVAPGGG